MLKSPVIWLLWELPLNSIPTIKYYHYPYIIASTLQRKCTDTLNKKALISESVLGRVVGWGVRLKRLFLIP